MYRAIMDRVIVRLCHENKSSLILSTAEQIRNCGVVLSVGDAVSEVKTGDKIMFHQYDELPLGQKDIVVVREKSILGIINESD